MNTKPWSPNLWGQPEYTEVLIDQINAQLKSKAESIRHNMEVVVSIDPRFTNEVVDSVLKDFISTGWEINQKGNTKVYNFRWNKAQEPIDTVKL